MPARFAAIYLALTGGVRDAEEIARARFVAEAVLAEGDAPAALASGTFGGPGIGLIAGTGAVTVAQTARGERLQRGGWGYLVGDEGSGYWIGMRTIQSAARMLDGRGPGTVLLEQVQSHFHESDLKTVAWRIYGGELDRPEIAALAPTVLHAAEEGDVVAATILDAAAEELGLLVEATARAAAFTEEREMVIVATGGVLRPENALWSRLSALIHYRLPEYRLIAPRFPPVIGAFILALQLARVEVDQAVITRITESAAPFAELASAQRTTS